MQEEDYTKVRMLSNIGIARLALQDIAGLDVPGVAEWKDIHPIVTKLHAIQESLYEATVIHTHLDDVKQGNGNG